MIPTQLARFGSALVAAACALPTHAQVPAITRDTATPEEQFQRKAPDSLQLETPSVPQPQLGAATTVTVQRFRFSGSTRVEDAELQRIVAPWSGRALTATDLADALRAITAYLRDRGLYAAFARFPEQSVATGEALIEIIEGRVGSVELQQDSPARLRPFIARGFVDQLKPGARIARGELDTPLLLLNDLPGVRVQPSLTAGPDGSTANVAVKVEDEPLIAGFVRLDNHQVRELGQYELTAHMRLRDPLGIGDLATVEGVRSHTGDWLRGTLAYSVPVNYRGTRVGALFSNQRYRLAGDFEPLLANGDAHRYSVVATHPLVRMDDRNLSVSLSLNSVRYSDRIDVVAASSESRHHFATARMSGDRTDGFLGGGVNAFFVEYEGGNVSINPPDVAAADAATLNTAGRFSRGRAHLERTQRLWAGANLYFAWTGQIASRNLAAGREILLSGPDAVRAYPAGELIADEGHLAKLEYRHVLARGARWRSIGTLFVDAAHGRINKSPLSGTTGNTRDIWGYGVALGAAMRDTLNAEISFAWRGSEAPLTDSRREPRIWFSLTYFF